MFDNVTSPNNQPTSDNRTAPSAFRPEPNWPPSGGAPNQPPVAPGIATEDIFSDTDNAPSAALAGKPAVFQPAAAPAPIPDEGGGKKVLVLVLLVAALAVFGAGAWYAYRLFGGQRPEVSPTMDGSPIGEPIGSEDVTLDQVEEPADPTPAPPTPVDQPAPVEAAAPVTAAPDSDLDGLTNEEETVLGTDPLKNDSDSDGLYDREEIKVYRTDPLKADSDGDGFQDGQEVAGGYNPLGAGKLYEIN